MRVLVVDDDPDILEAVNICFALRWEDAELIEAPESICLEPTATDRRNSI